MHEMTREQRTADDALLDRYRHAIFKHQMAKAGLSPNATRIKIASKSKMRKWWRAVDPSERDEGREKMEAEIARIEAGEVEAVE